jgi:hypothetical protein
LAAFGGGAEIQATDESIGRGDCSLLEGIGRRLWKAVVWSRHDGSWTTNGADGVDGEGCDGTVFNRAVMYEIATFLCSTHAGRRYLRSTVALNERMA